MFTLVSNGSDANLNNLTDDFCREITRTICFKINGIKDSIKFIVGFLFIIFDDNPWSNVTLCFSTKCLFI